MNFSEIIVKEYSADADKRIAFVGQFMVGFMVLIALMNIVGIFKINSVPLYATVAASIVELSRKVQSENTQNLK